ncbi:MAG: protein kinase, partial [Planctomycetaceae bacterium]|nr:protein kinase [Planctomycetaceae bacterium]
MSSALNISNAADLCAALNDLCQPGQILLTRQPFDESRQSVAAHPVAGSKPLIWHSHGRYLMRNTEAESDSCEEAFDVFEVGCAVLQPTDTKTLWSSETEEQERMRGWRPSIGKPVPTRESWIIKRKLGEGGFGEAWLAEHQQTRRHQVFKFCFDLERLRSFRRELAVFRLLQEELGDRNDIARLREAQTDKPPFYLESEFVEAGNLQDWADTQGGLESISLDERLRITKEVCAAVAAAHRVGVFHRDLKPSNIFMRQDAAGAWHPLLADFGIGALADSSLLKKHDITYGSLMHSMLIGSSRGGGTRMYKPPEADNCNERGTTQADVYALGVILFQMVTADFTRPAGIGWEQYLPDSAGGAAPGETNDELESGIQTELLRDDIHLAIHVDPESRLGSVDALLERLKSLPDRIKTETTRRLTERIQRRNRRLRNLLSFTAVSLFIVGSLSVFSAFQWKNATDASERIVKVNEDLKDANQALQNANKDITRQNSEIAGLNTSLEVKIEEASAERDEKERQRSLAARRLFQMQLGNAEAARRSDNIPLQLAWLKSAAEIAGDDIDEHERANIRERAALAELRSPVLEQTLKVQGPLVRVATDLYGNFIATYSRLSPHIGPVVFDATTGKRLLGPLPNRNATPAQFVAIDDAGSRLA